MSFKNYHSNPVTRQTHEIQKGNVITSLAFGDFETVVDGKPVVFTANIEGYRVRGSGHDPTA